LPLVSIKAYEKALFPFPENSAFFSPVPQATGDSF
jgi:hypothetical protein